MKTNKTSLDSDSDSTCNQIESNSNPALLAASSSSLSTSSSRHLQQSIPSASPSLLAECKALQQDELIALQSIYTSKDQFSVINNHNSAAQESQFDLTDSEPKLRLSIPINFSPATRKVRITTSFATPIIRPDSIPLFQSQGNSVSVTSHADSVASFPVNHQSPSSSYANLLSSIAQDQPDSLLSASINHIGSEAQAKESSIPKGSSIDAVLAKQARRSSTLSNDRNAEDGLKKAEASGPTSEPGVQGNGKGRRKPNENGKGKGRGQAPWELRAQVLAASNSSDPISSNPKKKNPKDSKIGIVEGSPKSSNANTSSSSNLSSNQIASHGELNPLNPNAKAFSLSSATTAASSASSTSSSSLTQDEALPSTIIPEASRSMENSYQEVERPLSTSEIIEVSHLPSITLYLSLPPTYPLESPPTILSLSSPYLTETPTSERVDIREWIQNRLLASWKELKSEILWSWGEFCSEGIWNDAAENPFFKEETRPEDVGQEIIDFFEVVSQNDPSSSSLDSLSKRLIDFDKATQSETFSTLSFRCSICLESRRGSKCFQIKSCSHVFCLECLKDYFSLLIVEGFHLQASRCPDPECVKKLVSEEDEESESKRKETDHDQDLEESLIEQGDEDLPKGRISSKELLDLLGPTLHSRYLWLIKKSLLESNPTASNCPRQNCDGISILKQEDIGGRFETYRSCPICQFSWCTFCRKTWHGFTPCKLNNSTELVDEFLIYKEGSIERDKMYRKYGKKNLDRYVKNVLEEKANLEWLDGSTARCPSCQIRIEKSAGCNHMTCFCCHSHFCYLCQQRLNPKEPYRHFNTPNTPCFQRLFEGALPAGMGPDGQLIPGFEGIAVEGDAEEEDLDEANFPARLLQEMLREI